MIQYKKFEKEYINSSTMLIEFNIDNEWLFMEELFSIQSKSGKEQKMTKFLSKKLSELNIKYTIDKVGNILATKGELSEGEFYPCLIAHQDTVFEEIDNISMRCDFEHDKNKIYAITKIKDKLYYTGCGFDDKNGIWIALRMLDYFPKLKLYFSVGEEVGGTGSNAVDMTFFNDVGYCIQCDRRGNNEVITDISFDKICSEDFIDSIKKSMDIYGYKEGSGMFTDVAVLRDRKINVSCINIGCGYYNPHSHDEYTIVEDLFRCAQLVKSILIDCATNRYEHIIIDKPWKSNTLFNDYDYGNYSDYHSYNYYDTWKTSHTKKTCSCQVESFLIDVECPIHNDTLTKLSGIMCSCGEELEEREHSYFCNFCSKTFILEY